MSTICHLLLVDGSTKTGDKLKTGSSLIFTKRYKFQMEHWTTGPK